MNRINNFIGWLLFHLGRTPNYSHNIAEQLTAGYGKLDEYGFWQYPAPIRQKQLIRGGHCGCCGKWLPGALVDSDWSWSICPEGVGCQSNSQSFDTSARKEK